MRLHSISATVTADTSLPLRFRQQWRFPMAETSLKPGGTIIDLAHSIERYFNVALFLLVVSGFIMLASTGGLDLPAVALVGMALLVRGYLLFSQNTFQIPES